MSAAVAVNPGPGVVYTETVVHSAPEAYVSDAPYQLVIIQLENGRRITGRIDGERATIGDHVAFIELRKSVPFFRKQA